MGTSGAYTGSGGSDGKAIRDAISSYLDSTADPTDPAQPTDGSSRLNPEAMRRILNLIRPRPSGGSGAGSSGGSVGGGHPAGTSAGRPRNGGGPQRSVARSARTAGRAAAAAYAYRTGDAETLQRLGLDYNQLRGLGDQFEVLRRIVDMACSTSDSTIEDHEQRLVAAGVAEWVLELESSGYIPAPEEIVRQTIALIIAEALLSESGDLINSNDRAVMAEQDVRDAAEALANRTELSVDGATEDEITHAIESGIETLRSIRGGSP
ncbi:MAG: hypothetical protein M3R02_21545 [Chloroflexota bacterium]|nr:hypothetical protein [Chloroflexota bacterium]